MKGLKPINQDKLASLLCLFITFLLFSTEISAFAGPVVRTINFIKNDGILVGIALGGLTFVYGICTLFTPNPRWKLLIFCFIGVACLIGADEVIRGMQRR